MIAALVLWAVATVALLRSFREYARPVARARELAVSGRTEPSSELTGLNQTTTGLLLRSLASGVVVLVVIDTIWKPGA